MTDIQIMELLEGGQKVGKKIIEGLRQAPIAGAFIGCIALIVGIGIALIFDIKVLTLSGREIIMLTAGFFCSFLSACMMRDLPVGRRRRMQSLTLSVIGLALFWFWRTQPWKVILNNSLPSIVVILPFGATYNLFWVTNAWTIVINAVFFVSRRWGRQHA